MWRESTAGDLDRSSGTLGLHDGSSTTNRQPGMVRYFDVPVVRLDEAFDDRESEAPPMPSDASAPGVWAGSPRHARSKTRCMSSGNSPPLAPSPPT